MGRSKQVSTNRKQRRELGMKAQRIRLRDKPIAAHWLQQVKIQRQIEKSAETMKELHDEANRLKS